MQLTYESTSRSVDLPSGQMHYNEAGAGHPIILIHGSGAGASGWSNFAPNIAALAAHFHVLAVDIIGWGASATPREGKYVGEVQVIELMDALGLQKAAVVGNSMGGMLAVAAAARYPERITHLITMGCGAFLGMPALFAAGDGPTEGIKVLLEGYLNPSIETMKKLTSIMAYDKALATDELAAGRVKATVSRPDHIANALAGFRDMSMFHWQATPAETLTITAPSLLVHGRDDRVVPFENSLRLVAHIPNSRLVLINRCGHWAQLEHAEEFNRLVVDFVANN